MIKARDRIGFSRRKARALSAVPVGSLGLGAKFKQLTAVTLLSFLTAFLVLSYASTAQAEPPLSEESAVELTAGSAAGEETATADAEEREVMPKEITSDAASSGQGLDKKTPVQPRIETGGEFLLGDYQDPGAPQEKKSFLVGAFETIVNIIKYIVYFALVLGVGFLAILGLKFFTTKYNSMTGGQELIHVLDIRYLAPGKAVCLVEAAGKVLVVGLAGNNINPLAEIDDFEQIEALKNIAAAKPEPLQPFQAYLEKFSGRFSKAQKKPQTKSRRPARREPEASVSTENHWRDDLHSTGQNINQLLEEIKKQDSKRSEGAPSSNKGRGEKSR